MTERLETGDIFPSFILDAPDGGTVDTGKIGPAVVFFYPKDDTPGCTTENKDFTSLKTQFEAAGVALLGISKDPPAKHVKFIAKHELSAPLASDAEEDGLADALGIWVEKNMYGRKYMDMERTTYLLDADGVISRVWRKVKVKGHANEVLAAAQGA